MRKIDGFGGLRWTVRENVGSRRTARADLPGYSPMSGAINRRRHRSSVTDVGRLNRAKVCGRKPLLLGIRWVSVVRFTVSVQIPKALVRQRLCVDARMQRIGIYLNARLIGGRRGRVGRGAYCEGRDDKHDCDGSYG
jgi:hypothetical protein